MKTDEERHKHIRTFLMASSGQQLSDFLLASHNRRANLRKQVFELMEEWAEEAANARLVAEVAAIREELKHASVLPFPKKVEELPAQSEAPAPRAGFDSRNHRDRNFYAVRTKPPH